MFRKSLLLFRIKDWWHYIFPPLLGFAYLHLLYGGDLDAPFLSKLLLLSLSIFGTASFGFLLNDITDRKEDILSGKYNYAALLSKKQMGFLLAVTVFLALLPWLYLITYKVAFSLYMFQLGLLVLYSVPPFRVKKNVWFCVLVDAFYSSIIPVFVVFFIFPVITPKPYLYLYHILVFVLFFLKGLRNILMHQLLEATQDKKANITTFVLKYKEEPISAVLKNVLVPIELVLIICFSAFIAVFVSSWFWLIIPIFLCHFCLKQFTAIYAKTQKTNIFQTLNDYYEDYFPLVIIVFATLDNMYLTGLLALHLVLFPKTIRNHLLPLLSWIYYTIFVHTLYHGILVWLYYKAFHNKYVKRERHKK